MNQEYYIGQIFEGKYPPEAAIACNQNGWYIEVIGDHRYEIKAIPPAPAPTKEEQEQAENRRCAYIAEVDPITSHISRLKDEEQTEEIIAEIEQLKAERTEKRNAIKERFPYYEQESEERFADDSNTIENTEE